MVLHFLDIKSGSLVIESGTGSGSLSTSILKSVLPDGYLYTFEFNESRVKAVKKEFKEMQLEKYVTVTHRDVLTNGFNLDIEDEQGEKTDLCKLQIDYS